MTTQQIIERLDATIAMLKELKTEQFDYTRYVSHTYEACPTVACVAGWYPSKFKDTGLMYLHTFQGRLKLVGQDNNVDSALMEYHGLNRRSIKLLFYGIPAYRLELRSESLQDVIRLFELFTTRFKEDENFQEDVT